MTDILHSAASSAPTEASGDRSIAATSSATTRARTASRAASGIAMPATRMTARATSSTRSGGNASYRASQPDTAPRFSGARRRLFAPCPRHSIHARNALLAVAGCFVRGVLPQDRLEDGAISEEPGEPESLPQVLSFCATAHYPARMPAASPNASQGGGPSAVSIPVQKAARKMPQIACLQRLATEESSFSQNVVASLLQGVVLTRPLTTVCRTQRFQARGKSSSP